MIIQWFPGHMLETKKLLKDSISKVDIILEVLDARLPVASANPLLQNLCKTKIMVKLLNKSDLADPKITQQWLKYFKTQINLPAMALNGKQKKNAFQALEYCKKIFERNRARKIKIMVVGIPNTGKSTLLNTLAGKKIAKTGNVPAATRHKQRMSLKDNIDLYDTPGILWPVIEPEEKACILAASGAISDTAIDYSQIAFFVAKFLLQFYPDSVLNRYPFIQTLPTQASELIALIGAARGCLKKGGMINLQKASEILIRDLRAGKIGRISFERPLIKKSFHEAIKPH